MNKKLKRTYFTKHDNLSSFTQLRYLKRSFLILLDECRMLATIVYSTIKKKRHPPPIKG